MTTLTPNSGKEQDWQKADAQYSTFFVGDLFFGIDVLSVQEVLRFQEMTCVPLAPEVIEGLINLRGQIVTAIDMAEAGSAPALDRCPPHEHGGANRG